MEEQGGIIFDIQRFALHDGPGIRTTIFFKGCSNRCAWCHNPESFVSGRQLQYYPLRCTGCGQCAGACPNDAHSFDGGRHAFDRGKCTGCGACADICAVNALVKTGRRVSAGDVLREAMEDAVYYETSGGGVTLSGGEPVIQSGFALELLKRLKEKNIHTALQTAGNYPFEQLEPLLPYLNLVMYDIKAVSEEIYDGYIQKGCRARILDNILKLGKTRSVTIAARTPVISGVNSGVDEIAGIARFLQRIDNLAYYALIPYHGLGRAKYDALGLPYGDGFSTPSPGEMEALERTAARYVPVYNNNNGFIEEAEDGLL